jgi:hypothetical protein
MTDGAPRSDRFESIGRRLSEQIVRMFQAPAFRLVIAVRSLYVVEIADDNISPRISAPAIVAREA